MKYLTVFLITISLFSCSNQSSKQAKQQRNTLRDSLILVMEQDQYYRNHIAALEEEFGADADTVQEANIMMHAQDSINLAYIIHLLDNQGWPSRSTVGDTAVLAPFFILQHSGDAEIMNQYFPYVKAMIENGDVSPRMLAYYTDRLAMLRKEPQVFGTQVIFNEASGRLELYPVKNIDSVNYRRSSAELGPLEEYLKSMGADIPVMP